MFVLALTLIPLREKYACYFASQVKVSFRLDNFYRQGAIPQMSFWDKAFLFLAVQEYEVIYDAVVKFNNCIIATNISWNRLKFDSYSFNQSEIITLLLLH